MRKTYSFVTYRITFDEEVYLRKVNGTYSQVNGSWENYNATDALPLPAMLAANNDSIFTLNQIILSEPYGLGISFKCGDAILNLTSADPTDPGSNQVLYITKPVANPLFGFLKVPCALYTRRTTLGTY